MTATLELQLKPGLKPEKLAKLLAIATARRVPVETIICEAIEEYAEQNGPAEVQLPLVALNGLKLSPSLDPEANGEVRR
jgi:hypothetical protein